MTVNELCNSVSIVEYLESKGVEVFSKGQRWNCCCPLPDHEDDTPSFYIGSFSDGGQYYKCFGCGASGNILTLRSKLESMTKGAIIRDMASSRGVKLDKYEAAMFSEPENEDVMIAFCQEDNLVSDISTYARLYLRANGNGRAAVDQVCRLYQRMDEKLEVNDMEGMREVQRDMMSLLKRNSLKMSKIKDQG